MFCYAWRTPPLAYIAHAHRRRRHGVYERWPALARMPCLEGHIFRLWNIYRSHPALCVTSTMLNWRSGGRMKRQPYFAWRVGEQG